MESPLYGDSSSQHDTTSSTLSAVLSEGPDCPFAVHEGLSINTTRAGSALDMSPSKTSVTQQEIQLHRVKLRIVSFFPA